MTTSLGTLDNPLNRIAASSYGISNNSPQDSALSEAERRPEGWDLFPKSLLDRNPFSRTYIPGITNTLVPKRKTATGQDLFNFGIYGVCFSSPISATNNKVMVVTTEDKKPDTIGEVDNPISHPMQAPVTKTFSLLITTL